jgi:hypothetical protein
MGSNAHMWATVTMHCGSGVHLFDMREHGAISFHMVVPFALHHLDTFRCTNGVIIWYS